MTALTFTLSSEDKAQLQAIVQSAVKEEVRDALRQMQMEHAMEKNMTKKELREFLKISDSTLSILINHRPGFPVSHKIGENSPRFNREEIIDWMFPKDKAVREQREREFQLSEWDKRSQAQ